MIDSYSYNLKFSLGTTFNFTFYAASCAVNKKVSRPDCSASALCD